MQAQLLRCNSTHLDFRQLVSLLDQHLAVRNGKAHSFYTKFNKLENLHHCVVAYLDQTPVGCGAIRRFSEDTMELKRMFVASNYRGQGIATQVLGELEAWTAEQGYTRCILETGSMLPEAVRFYRKSGYQRIPNFGQYAEMETSVCMEKILL